MRKNIYVIIVVAMLIMFACESNKSSSGPNKVALPDGWTLPAKSLTVDDWRNKDSNRYLEVTGDFNGDGISDTAKLLARADGSGIALCVFLSAKGAPHKFIILSEKKDIQSLKSLGIERVAPGRYETACGKGFTECRKDEPKQLIVTHDAINYFKYDSANMFYYWDQSVNAFKGIGITD